MPSGISSNTNSGQIEYRYMLRAISDDHAHSNLRLSFLVFHLL